ncbi:MAG: Integral membrane protein, partial [uncultured Arthrobacter sp.]
EAHRKRRRRPRQRRYALRRRGQPRRRFRWGRGGPADARPGPAADCRLRHLRPGRLRTGRLPDRHQVLRGTAGLPADRLSGRRLRPRDRLTGPARRPLVSNLRRRRRRRTHRRPGRGQLQPPRSAGLPRRHGVVRLRPGLRLRPPDPSGPRPGLAVPQPARGTPARL